MWRAAGDRREDMDIEVLNSCCYFTENQVSPFRFSGFTE